MKRIAALVALGIAAYLLFGALTVPASVVAARVAGATEGAVQVTDATGTLWNGTARARITPRRGAPVTLDTVSWSFKPARLIAGRFAYDVRVAASSLVADLELARGFGGWEGRDVRASGDASGLAIFSPLFTTMRPQGPITLTAPQLTWNGTALRGEATLEWKAASVGWSQVSPLGSYQARLKAADGPAQLAITTLAGPLTVTGQGTITPPARVAFTGEAKADAAQAQALEPLLGMLGPRRADGATTLDWRIQ